MSRKHDWDYYRHRYVTEGLTLERLAELPNAPHLSTIKKRSTAGKWDAERTAYRNRTATKAQEVALTTEAEVSARHVKIAQALQGKALQALQKVDVSKLPPSEIRQFLATAADIERKALGMDNKFTLKGVGNLDELSDEELLALARRAGVLRTDTPTTPQA